MILGIDTIAELASVALRSEYDRLETLAVLNKQLCGAMKSTLDLAPSYKDLDRALQMIVCDLEAAEKLVRSRKEPTETRIRFLESATSILSYMVNST